MKTWYKKNEDLTLNQTTQDEQVAQDYGLTDFCDDSDIVVGSNGMLYLKSDLPEPTREEISQLREQAYAKKVDSLHAQKLRHQVLGDWTEEDEAEYEANVIRLSQEIAEQYPYPEE